MLSLVLASDLSSERLWTYLSRRDSQNRLIVLALKRICISHTRDFSSHNSFANRTDNNTVYCTLLAERHCSFLEMLRYLT